MGFNYYNLGNIHPCWVENGFIHYEVETSHTIYKHETALQVNLPRQTNIFYSELVAFYLQDLDNVYVGRYDGVISIYRKTDNMLIGLSNWKAPMHCGMNLVGFYYTPAGKREIYLDSRDSKTVYVSYKSMEGLLERAVTKPLIDALGYVTEQSLSEKDSYVAFDERGESVAINFWHTQDSLWRRDCRIFI